MERDNAVTTTIDRILKLLARGGNGTGQAAKGSEIRIVASDDFEVHKMEIRLPLASTLRIRRH
jgi:hypothetical protein